MVQESAGRTREEAGVATSLQKDTRVASKSEHRKAGFWVLVTILAVSGVATAFIAVFGLFESTAYSIVWRVFVADLYLIASFAAQHRWLRRASWIAIGMTLVLGLVHVFWQFTPYSRWADGRTRYTVGDPSTGWSPWFGFEGDLEAAAHITVLGLLWLGFVSLAYRWVKEQRVIRTIYLLTFVTLLAAVALGVLLILDSPHRWDIGWVWGQLEAGIVILALTGTSIVLIGAFVQRRSSSMRTPLQSVGQRQPSSSGEAARSDRTGDTRGSDFTAQIEQADLPARITQELSEAELRTLVREVVDEALRERGL